MSIFASKVVSPPIPIPFDPPHTIVVRKLTGKQVDLAQAAHQAAVARGEDRQWNATFRRILQQGIVGQTDLAAVLADPLTGFDRYSLVRAGLVSWTYDEPILSAAPIAKDGIETPRDAIADLDDEAVTFIATEVIRLTKPKVFQTIEQAEDTRKND